MSAGSHVEHASDHGHDDHGDGADHGSLKGYLTGFGLSVVLTAIPFWLVMAHVLPTPLASVLTIMAFAVVQIVVHMIYFLHMNTRSQGGWTVLALIFTLVLVTILVIGSLWVMYHLNTSMMPMSAADMRTMP